MSQGDDLTADEIHSSEAAIAKESIWTKELSFSKKHKAGWSMDKSQKAINKEHKKASLQSLPSDNKPVSSEKGPEKKHPYLRVLGYSVLAIFLCFSFCLIIFASGVFVYKLQYQNKVLFGTKILGQEIGGKNIIEVRNLISDQVQRISLAFAVDGQNYSIKPDDAGVAFDAEATATKAIEAGKSGAWHQPWLNSTASLIYKVSPSIAESISPELKNNLPIEYNLDESKLSTLTQNLSDKFNVQSKNAGLVMKGTDVQVIPAIYGKKIMTDSVKDQLAAAVKTGQTATISIAVEQVNPNIVETDTQVSINAAKAILDTPVVFHYQGQNFTPDRSTVGSWIVFNTKNVNGEDQLVPSVEPKQVYSYIFGLAQKINVAAINKKVTVKNGTETIVDSEGKDGLAVDVDSASVATARALSASKAVNMELPTRVVKAKTNVNNVIVANWDKYITVDLSEQRMCAYLAGGVQQNCWSVTTGATARGYHTPVGTFLILRKAGAGGRPGASGGGVCMPNPPYSTPLCGINYVSYFTSSGHAIHEAWWRTSFGGNPAWNGSHGCVNATYSIAKWIYDWAPIGTPVIVQY